MNQEAAVEADQLPPAHWSGGEQTLVGPRDVGTPHLHRIVLEGVHDGGGEASVAVGGRGVGQAGVGGAGGGEAGQAGVGEAELGDAAVSSLLQQVISPPARHTAGPVWVEIDPPPPSSLPCWLIIVESSLVGRGPGELWVCESPAWGGGEVPASTISTIQSAQLNVLVQTGQLEV